MGKLAVLLLRYKQDALAGQNGVGEKFNEDFGADGRHQSRKVLLNVFDRHAGEHLTNRTFGA